MRYMPTLRSPVSGSLVTTQGRVMKRPPSSGQHFWMGRFNRLGDAIAEWMSLAFGQGSVWVGGASNLWITSLHGPFFTGFGLAWRRSIAWPSSFSVSRSEVGGLAFISEPSSAATSFTEFALSERAIRFHEPIVLIATGNGDATPFTVGFSINNAFPPPGDFISRSA